MPSTACAVVLNAIETVTYSGSSTVTAHRIRMIVPDQFTRSMLKRPLAGFGATPSRTSVASIDVDDESWLDDIRGRSFRG